MSYSTNLFSKLLLFMLGYHKKVTNPIAGHKILLLKNVLRRKWNPAWIGQLVAHQLGDWDIGCPGFESH